MYRVYVFDHILLFVPKHKVFDVSTILFLSGSQYIKPKTYLKRETFCSICDYKNTYIRRVLWRRRCESYVRNLLTPLWTNSQMFGIHRIPWQMMYTETYTLLYVIHEETCKSFMYNILLLWYYVVHFLSGYQRWMKNWQQQWMRN